MSRTQSQDAAKVVALAAAAAAAAAAGTHTDPINPGVKRDKLEEVAKSMYGTPYGQLEVLVS